MKDIIKRIKRDIEYEHEYDNEPCLFKILVGFVAIFATIIKGLIIAFLFITTPIWIWPYLYYIKYQEDKEWEKQLRQK